MADLPIGDITSANATMIITVNSLFPAGFQVQQFSVDNAADMEELEIAVTRQSLEGGIVAGYVPSIKTVRFSIEASSPSYEPLCQLYRASEAKRGFYEVGLSITVPELGKSYVYSRGLLVRATILPPMRRVLEPTSWTFHFGKFYVAGV